MVRYNPERETEEQLHREKVQKELERREATAAAISNVRSVLLMAFPEIEKQLYMDHVRSLSDKKFKPELQTRSIGEYTFRLLPGENMSRRIFQVSKYNDKPAVEFLIATGHQSDNYQRIDAGVALVNNQEPLEVKGIHTMNANFGKMYKELKETQGRKIEEISENAARKFRNVI